MAAEAMQAKRVLIAVVLALTACSGAGTHPPERGTRLTIGQGREFNSLMALGNNGFTTEELIGLTGSWLVTLDPHGYAPDAATAVPTRANGGISRDGRTVTYHLRHGMRWQDGVPLTARDVLFTQKVMMDPHTLAPYRDGFDNVRAISAPDPETVVVKLAHPDRLFVMNWLGPEAPTAILPEHVLAHEPDLQKSAFAALPLASGPYRIVRWQHGDRATFEANPMWYGAPPPIKTIVVRFIPEATTRLTELRTHEIDAELATSAQTAAQARAITGVRVTTDPAPEFEHIVFNLHAPIVSERAVRRAIAEAIDTQSIARTISHGLLTGRDGARGLYLWTYDPHAGYPVYDPRAAAARLDAAGWHLASDGIRRDANGRRLAFPIAIRADRADDATAAVDVQNELRAIGIDLTIKTYSAPLFTANDSFIRTGKFTAELTTYFANIEPDPSIFFACADRGLNGFNESGYCDPATDALIAASMRTTDRHRIADLLAQVQRRINAEMPAIFIWQSIDTNVIPAALHNFADMLGTPFANAGTWSLR
jgi:peptide/nickel transport system substrate-binding protein